MPVTKRNRFRKIFLWLTLVVLLLLNGIAAVHAYKFTHFSEGEEGSSQTAALPVPKKVELLLTGVNQPKPKAKRLPKMPFTTIRLQSNKALECWLLQTDSAKGTVALFHGYGSEKSGLLKNAEAFLAMGYNALLVDFMGSGGSEGVQTTIGFKEAEQVKTVFEFLQQQEAQQIHLFGSSIGAVAIMKAVADFQLQPTSVILECPFGTFYETVSARFAMFGVPSFPMAHLLLFWGSVLNGYWAYSHNPDEYATDITCPALLLYGAKDPKVSPAETDRIFANLAGPKQLKTFPLAAHENYLLNYKHEWMDAVQNFLVELQ